MVMPTAQILKDRTTAAVRKVIRGMEINVMVSYSHTVCLKLKLAVVRINLNETDDISKDKNEFENV